MKNSYSCRVIGISSNRLESSNIMSAICCSLNLVESRNLDFSKLSSIRKRISANLLEVVLQRYSILHIVPFFEKGMFARERPEDFHM